MQLYAPSPTASIPATEYRAGVDFRVLGTSQVVHGGQALNVGGLKQRTVLALLVASSAEPVSTDALIDGVYGDGAPAGARRSVQTYVSNLRRLTGGLIESVGGGYVLRARPEQVDAERFGRAVQSASELNEPAERSGALRDALAIWRGHAYADVEAFHTIAVEVTRLSELRLSAIGQRIDADLEQGLHRELIAELEALAIDHPERERFRAQHMLALYRAGRQAEAIRAYRAARQLLIEEMGLEPSPQLRGWPT